MSNIGERYRAGALRYWDALVKIAGERGVERGLIPKTWSYDAERFVYTLIGLHTQRGRPRRDKRLPADLSKRNKLLAAGHAVVQRELNPAAKIGRPKGAIEKNPRSKELGAQKKRKQRANLWNPNLTDKEWHRRFDLWLARRK